MNNNPANVEQNPPTDADAANNAKHMFNNENNISIRTNSSNNLPTIADHPNDHMFFPSALPTTMAQVSFVLGIRSILEDLGDSVTPEIFLDQLREDFPPYRLLHPSVLKDSEYHKKLRSLMENIGVVLLPHPPSIKRLVSRRIAYTVMPTGILSNIQPLH